MRGRPNNFGNLAEFVKSSERNAYNAWIAAQLNSSSMTWKDIEWLRALWKGKLVLKGIMEVEDAIEATDVGADEIIVSNHGARQLDSVASSISKLPTIIAAVGGRSKFSWTAAFAAASTYSRRSRLALVA